MDIFSKIAILWLALDMVILASVWYAVSTIRPLFPRWWRAFVCDRAPKSFN
jgi:hypothetical protein